MRVELNLYPHGKHKALTMSYDDGRDQDRRLVKIFNEYGIKGTFHLNSGLLGKEGRITSEELPILFKGHEISCHSVSHPFLEKIPRENIITELLEDRRTLEQVSGYPVRGMSYPFGTYNNVVVDTLRAIGIEYSRTTYATGSFNLPDDFMLWHPTCHHNNDCLNKLEKFDKLTHPSLPLFYIWGHSYEFDNNNNWDLIEDICRAASKLNDVWFATNIEILDYINALRSLKFSVDCNMIYNPSAISVWVSVDGKGVEIRGGETFIYSKQ